MQSISLARHLWLNLNVAWDQMKVAEENLEFAEKSVYDQMARFKAGLALNDGEMFNPGGKGFMRLNVGTTRQVLHEALLNVEKAILE